MVNTMIDFINKSPTAFSAISNIKKILLEKIILNCLKKMNTKYKKDKNILLQEMIQASLHLMSEKN